MALNVHIWNLECALLRRLLFNSEKQGYILDPTQGHSEVLCRFDCLPNNQNNCVVKTLP